MKTLINNFKKWLNPPVEDELHINWFGVINRVKDDACDTEMKQSLDDRCNHAEIETVYKKDIEPKLYTDEIERLRELSKSTKVSIGTELINLTEIISPLNRQT